MLLLKEKSLLTFPCDFTLKIFGKKTETFEANVLNIIKKKFPNLAEDCLKQRSSKEEKYSNE